ncbi:hypothetical protein ACFVT5_17095 [Streptomyces sp. NPDC058001]|uniref:hypothetical protein n=1 Tax=Streptomyces sp. NPDC058001 TaxID=3346300 RepID=UPI0036E5FD66
MLEIVCDESGSDGENLIGGNTDVFAHAGVRVAVEDAAAALVEIRDRVRSPAREYKATHLLREKHRSVLTWFLGPSGPPADGARVHLTDKAFFVVGRVVELLVGEQGRPPGVEMFRDPGVEEIAVALYRAGCRMPERARWRRFLIASNDMMRLRFRAEGTDPVEAFFQALDGLCPPGAEGEPAGILDLLRRNRSRAEVFRARIDDTPDLIPAMDPLFPAIVATAAHAHAHTNAPAHAPAYGQGHPVSLVHDRQNMLTEERIAWLTTALPLAGLRLVESWSDPRVQLADFLAGVARKLASDELNDRGDPELTALLRPHVDPLSIWADSRSGSLLGVAPRGGGRSAADR